MRSHQTPSTALTSSSTAQPPLGTAASHRRDGEEPPRCHRSRTALSCHHAAVPAAPRCRPRSISVAKNRCSAFGASGHRILPGSVPALRSHPLSCPENLPPCPTRFLFSVLMSVCLSVCLSCSLFWLRHFKAPRGSLGIIFCYFFFFPLEMSACPLTCITWAAASSHCSSVHSADAVSPWDAPPCSQGPHGGTPAEPPAAAEQHPNTDYR